jgi:DNA polymerase-3 subunit epsilon
MEQKDKYCLVDTETTGLTSKDQVIEISIIDLDGNILLNTLCMPSAPICEEAMQAHGIDAQFLLNNNALSWEIVYPKVKKILDCRIMIAYNAEFDERLILQTCRDNNIIPSRISYECLMHNVMTWYSFLIDILAFKMQLGATRSIGL